MTIAVWFTTSWEHVIGSATSEHMKKNNPEAKEAAKWGAVGAGRRFFFGYSYSRAAYLEYAGVHFIQFSRPLSARWRLVASSPLPSA